MAENSAIQWTHHTFNPWIGCTKVSAGCANCYAEADMDKRRHRVQWGPHGTRSKTSAAYWREPLKWNRQAEIDGIRRRVFCASLSDVFEQWEGAIVDHRGYQLRIDDRWPTAQDWACGNGSGLRPVTMRDVRRELFTLIAATQNLDWLLLTKRPENIRRMMPLFVEDCGVCDNDGFVEDGLCPQCLGCPQLWPNVWLGASVENQEQADIRIPELLKCRDLAQVLFLSCEPLLGPIHLRLEECHDPTDCYTPSDCNLWVIVGGESGQNARLCRPQWIASIAEQCVSAGVPCFIKQLGSNVVTRNDAVEDVFNNGQDGWPDPDVEHHINGFREDYQGADCRIRLKHKKGGHPSEWPQILRIRQFPSMK